MSGKQAVIAVLAVTMCCLGSSAADQDELNQLTGIIGRTFISDQGIKGGIPPNKLIRSGKGLTFEVNYSRRLFGTSIYSLSGEIPAVFNLDEDINSGNLTPSDYKQIFVAPSARVNLFPVTAVSPWVSFGGGFAPFSPNKNLIFFGKNPGGSSPTRLIQGGAGREVGAFYHPFRPFSFRRPVP